MAAPDLGTGTTLTYTGFSVNLLSISMSGPTRESIDTSHMGTTTARTFVASDLYDCGEVSVEFQFAGSISPVTPITAAASNLVIVWGGSGTYTVSAQMTGWECSASTDELMTGTATFKLTSTVVVT